MIVPAPRLIWLVALVGFPAMVAEAILPRALVPALAAMAIVLVAALADAALRKRATAGIRIELPPLLRWVQGRPSEILVRVHNAAGARRAIRIGLAAPSEIVVEPEEQWLRLPPNAPLSELRWSCTPRARGTFRVDECRLEASSPLGLWAVRWSLAVSAEIRVYPDLRRNLTLYALRRGSDDRHATRQIGRGREFEKLRDYGPGDGMDEIHWKATARRGRPITKVFQIERTQEVYVVIDASRLSARLVGEETVLEQAIRAALTINAITERKGDLFGVGAFSDQVGVFVRAGRGKAHYGACRDAINELSSQPVSPDFEDVSTFLRSRLHRRALIVVLTSLEDPVLAAHFERASRLLAARHLVIAAMLTPASVRPLFEGAAVDSEGEIYHALAGHMAWQQLREVQRTLSRQGITFALLQPDSFTPGLIRLYDDVKQRQLL